MKKLTMFYLPGCPYCRKANQALDLLMAENPVYRQVEIEKIDESARPDVAEAYDYFRVPTFFAGGDKLYEAHPAEDYPEIEAGVRAALDGALRGE